MTEIKYRGTIYFAREVNTLTLGERIKKVRREVDLTQQKFCERIGFKQNSISLIESGKRNISDQAIKSICREFNVSEVWLRTGEGDMFEPEETDAWEEVVKRRGLSGSDRLLIEKFMDLKPAERDVVMKYVLAVAADYTPVPDAVPASSDAQTQEERRLTIDEQVELYRQQLLLEEEQAVRSSVLQSSSGSEVKLA